MYTRCISGVLLLSSAEQFTSIITITPTLASCCGNIARRRCYSLITDPIAICRLFLYYYCMQNQRHCQSGTSQAEKSNLLIIIIQYYIILYSYPIIRHTNKVQPTIRKFKSKIYRANLSFLDYLNFFQKRMAFIVTSSLLRSVQYLQLVSRMSLGAQNVIRDSYARRQKSTKLQPKYAGVKPSIKDLVTFRTAGACYRTLGL